jgi:hypothetical protein
MEETDALPFGSSRLTRGLLYRVIVDCGENREKNILQACNRATGRRIKVSRRK